jgi:hypothetical protein
MAEPLNGAEQLYSEKQAARIWGGSAANTSSLAQRAVNRIHSYAHRSGTVHARSDYRREKKTAVAWYNGRTAKIEARY